MGLIWGVVVIALSMLCWGGQLVSAVAPRTAARLGLADAEADVDPVFWADGRGEALWDAIATWPMVVAGVLLVGDHSAWPYFGLAGGGGYLYFAGRGIVTRLTMQRRGMRIGAPRDVAVGLTALALWGAMAIVTIVASIVALEPA